MSASGVGLCSQSDKWSAGKRAAFRFGFLYFGLYCVTTQILGGLLPFPKVEIPDPATLAPVRPVVLWTAAHVFHAKTPLVYTGSGSGDKTFDWVLAVCTLAAAAVGTAMWTALDRRRADYTRLYRWFHAGMRFAVGSEMLLYGMVKLVPLQMPFPALARLVEPFGNFSPMGVLWSQVGASPAYEMCTGAAEILGGVLLFFPRTAMLGALVCLADASEIFTLNMTYDVPVKLFSFHLIVMSLVLLGPELRRMARFFFGTGSVDGPRLPRWGRRAVAAQAVYGLLLVAGNGYGARQSWKQYGGGAAKSELYGIWNVEEPGTGKDAWRRVIFDRPGTMWYQLMDDTIPRYPAKIDGKGGTITLTKAGDKNWKAELKFQRAGADAMRMFGEMDGKPVMLRLRMMDRGKMMLVSRGFHWIQEYPFNR
jgi:hypothetical protein